MAHFVHEQLQQQQQQAICLCNGTLVPRELIAHQQQQQHQFMMDDVTNLLANNLVGRMLDELVMPLRRLQLSEQERVALTALILLDGGWCWELNNKYKIYKIKNAHKIHSWHFCFV